MSIRFRCPNGHLLEVQDRFAGRAGACPKCQAALTVPRAGQPIDDLVCDFVGPPPAEDPDDVPVHQHAEPVEGGSGTARHGSSILARSTKACPKCRKEVSLAYDLCPYCHTYFTDRSEMLRRMTYPCPKCGSAVSPVDAQCPQCGANMRAPTTA